MNVPLVSQVMVTLLSMPIFPGGPGWKRGVSTHCGGGRNATDETIASSRNSATSTMVTQVNTSPVRVPKALLPAPPKAAPRPPPRPF